MSANAGLDQIITDQVNSLLQDPQNLPEEFLSWLPQFLSVNTPSLSNADLAGGTITPADGAKHNIDFGSGTLTFANSTTATDTQPHQLGSAPTVLIAFPGSAGLSLGGSGDGASITINGLLPSNFTGTIPYYWLAIV